MIRIPFFALLTVVLGCFSVDAAAQTSYPMVMSLSPVAAQAGTTTEHVVESRYSMFGAAQVLFTGTGVSAEVVTPMELDKDGKEPALTQISLKITVEPNAIPGVRDFRIVGPTGASTLGQLVIVRDPVIDENPKNDTVDAAQEISVPCTVCGTVEKAEDVDFYRFRVEQPQMLTFHCRGMRLEDRIHDLQTHIDPIITLRDAETGSTVAAADNTFAADPFLAWQLQPGSYLLELRDVRYTGNRYWKYCVEISDQPFVSQVCPLTVAAGQPTELQLIGFQLPDPAVAVFSAPSDPVPTGTDSVLILGERVSNPVTVVSTSLPVIMEAGGDNNEFAAAQAVQFPSVVNGRIESPSDIDCYAFDAKKGDQLTLEVTARRHWSGLDSIIRILNDQGRSLVENDDMRQWNRRTLQDSQIENWTVPADGCYAVEIRDVHLRGGDDFVYSLSLTRATPHFELTLDTDKTWLTPGTCAAVFVRAVRKNGFDGAIDLHVDGLPDGVTAHCGRILNGTPVDGCIVLEADPDAQPIAANIRVYGTAVLTNEGGDVTLESTAQPMQEIYMPGGGRNHWPVEMHTVAVGRPADLLDVRLSQHEITLKPGESVKVDVEIERAEGFDKNVTLDMLFQHLSSKFADTLPPGVTIDAKNSVTLLTGQNTAGAITLTAAKNAAPVSQHQCCVMANVSINFVMKATYSSRPLFITVTGE